MVACTGKQFCNIAVTETKGHAFQLIEALRTKHLALHGIRIHMSGCPSACAQNHTADIGLKGVRVKRLLGTREGFDVFLGGGLAGQIHLAIPYRLGVDVDQLPQVIEEVVGEFYLRHQPGQTFSAYWRERLRDEEAKKTGDKDYALPTWVCEGCDHHHIGEDPPVYCPKCAGLRRLFARIDPEVEATKQSPVAVVRPDGFVAVAKLDDLAEGAGRAVQVQGTEVALFRVDGELCAIDGVCPHAGASLGEGRCSNGVVTCPAHGWTFNVRDGSSVHPPNRDVRAHEVKVEDGMVLIKLAQEEPVVQGAAP
jgi:nitrite reductase/ring-hydroxylating ferredoxin subunit